MNIFKKYIYGLAVVVMTTSVCSCSEDDVPTYDTSYTALNIWVGTSAGAIYKSTSYNYSYAYEEGSVTFYAQISGMPADHDRTFHLEIFGKDADLVANTVRTEDYVIPAGEIGGTYQVYFNTQKLASPTLFTDREGEVQFRVVENDDFEIGVEGRQSFTVVLRNYLAKPDNWDSANFPRIPLSKYFGTYSRTKYQFMIEVLGLVDFEINYNTQTAYDEATNTVSSVYAVHLQQLMQKALNDYNETHDTPLTDEFGLPVTF